MEKSVISTVSNILPLDLAARFFNLLKANISRTKASISIVVVKVEGQQVSDFEDVCRFLAIKMRQNDTLFETGVSNMIGVLLTQSGEREATAFLRRIFQDFNEGDMTNNIMLNAHIADIRNAEAELPNILQYAYTQLQQEEAEWQIQLNPQYQVPTKEIVKVSILEENDIFRQVLLAEVQRLELKNFKIEIETFKDGFEFLESKFYLSAHTHLVIVNDILPRKNGMAVLHHLRSMPNQKKFIIHMMTSSVAEGDMIAAYKSGIDDYLIKPFNLRLFESKIERVFERLWA